MSRYFPLFFLFNACISINAQILSEINFSAEKGLAIESFGTRVGKQLIPSEKLNLFSFRILSEMHGSLPVMYMKMAVIRT